MVSPRAYLDWNATTPVHPTAKGAMVAAMDLVGNPSSVHAEGRAARNMLEAARAEVAALVRGEAENVVFTSGATEAAHALLGADGGDVSPILLCGDDHPARGALVYGATEHAAVIAAATRATDDRGVSVPVKPDAQGRISRDALVAMLSEWRGKFWERARPLVAVQLANNETGVIQDIPELAAAAHAAGAVMIVDAVQGPGKITVDLKAMGADAIFLSAHKYGGPKGVGAIIFAHSTTRLARALIAGGGQERGQRGGTENLIGIAGMGAVARVVREEGEVVEKLSQLRDHFESRLNHIAPDARIVGARAPRLPNTSCFAVPGIRAEAALIALDLDGIALSSGSACSSGKVKASHVLKAMGEPDWVQAGALRLSIGPTTTMEEIERCLTSLEKLMIRRRNAVSAA